MLDEFKEVEEYILSNEEMKDRQRLKLRALKNSLSGLRRPLTMLARYYIFHVFWDSGKRDIDEILKDTKGCLGAWLGDTLFLREENEEGFQLNRWLERYVFQAFGTEKIEAFRSEIIKKISDSALKEEICTKLDLITVEIPLEEKMRILSEVLEITKNKISEITSQKDLESLSNIFMQISYFPSKKNDRLFTGNDPGEKNDFNKITYDGILADALELGPLKQYYLVGTGTEPEDVEKKTVKKQTVIKKRLKTYKDEMDRILKFTACILLSSDHVENVEDRFIPITWVDLGNWTVNQSESGDFEKYSYNGKPLFEKKSIGKNERTEDSKGMAVMVKISADWMKNYHWKIIEAEKFDQSDYPDSIIFSDAGAGEYLMYVIKDPLD